MFMYFQPASQNSSPPPTKKNTCLFPPLCTNPNKTHRRWIIIWIFPQMVVPPISTRKWSTLSRKTPWLLGKSTILGKPNIYTNLFSKRSKRSTPKPSVQATWSGWQSLAGRRWPKVAPSKDRRPPPRSRKVMARTPKWSIEWESTLIEKNAGFFRGYVTTFLEGVLGGWAPRYRLSG